MTKDNRISIKQYEQAADEKVSLEGIKWLRKWDVCVQCDSEEEAEALRARLAQPEQEPWEALIESVRQMRDVQGMDGNWDYDPYMHGLFNGIEFALSLIEVREPKFRDAPQKWKSDLPKPRIFSENGY